jgi:hypothetical protein
LPEALELMVNSGYRGNEHSRVPFAVAALAGTTGNTAIATATAATKLIRPGPIPLRMIISLK